MSYTRYDVPNESGNVLSGLSLSYYDSMYIGSGGTATDTTMDYSYMYVSEGGVANKTTLNSGARASVFSGAAMNSTTVNSAGSVIVTTGGVISNTTVNSFGYVGVYSATANDNIVNEGGRLSADTSASTPTGAPRSRPTCSAIS